MKIWAFSDLHLRDVREWKFAPPPPLHPPADADVCVVAGDVSDDVGLSVGWLEHIAAKMPVVFVLGNHEFWSADYLEVRNRARRLSEGHPNFHVLMNDMVVIDGVRFLGDTLWTDFWLGAATTKDWDSNKNICGFMLDFAVIEYGDDRWTPDAAYRAHRQTKTFIDFELEEPHDGPTVVVTHHAPHPRSIAAQWKGSEHNPAFVSDMTKDILQWRPDVWIHGHVHSSFDYRVGSTRVICNPLGFVDENPDFDPALIVEVPT